MNDNSKNVRISAILEKNIVSVFAFGLLVLAPLSGQCEIQFKDVSHAAGIDQESPTAASAWGDLNQDGWPDLWVSNHHGLPPSIFINQKDGRFIDQSSKVLQAELHVDFHGAAWADFDNDGDEDLIAVTGGAAGRGTSPNFCFVNEHGFLKNKAKELGLDYPLGRGRTPLWLDANQDGKLDVLLMNRPRQNGSSALFVQTDKGFVNESRDFGFSQGQHRSSEGLLSRVKQFLHITKKKTSSPGININNEFAQLADLSGKNKMDLVAYMQPTRFYSIKPSELKDITGDIVVPSVSSVDDAAIGDFDGDGQMDIFLARAQSWNRDVAQVDANRIRGKMGSPKSGLNGIVFRTSGEVTFDIHRPWIDPTDARSKKYPKLYLGSKEQELKSEKFTISPETASVYDPPPSLAKVGGGVSIHFDPVTKVWTLNNLGQQIGFIITSTKEIESFKTKGFKPRVGNLSNILLLRKGNAFVQKKLRFTDQMTSCSSVTSGDFDNDMDLDLYLVCAGPVENFPNILYENDGHANFRKVKNAGGAEGSTRGRGNQVTMADYNLDGFLDLFVTNGAGPPPFAAEGPLQLFQNMANNNHWLEIDLHGVKSNRDGIGATLIVTANGKSQIRQQDGGMHSFSQNHARIHFGLGPNEQADQITIYWPSGEVQKLNNIHADQILVVEEKTQSK